jgi:hypothetical protein
MFTEPQMSALTPEKQAAKAIAHTLRNISERPGVAWYLGHGTQTYALLTEAHSTLHGITMEQAQQNWPPADQPKYTLNNLNQCPFCGGQALDEMREDETHFIQCNACKARGPNVHEYNHDTRLNALCAAINRWNARQMPR